MTWFERVILSLFPNWAARRSESRYIARQFTAAELDRLRGSNTYSSAGPIQENRASRDGCLKSARELDRNNSFAHGAFNSLVDNVVGPGIRLESRVKSTSGKLFENTNRKIESIWRHWTPGVDINGALSFHEIQQLVERELWTAGEILVHRVIAEDNRQVPLALEIIESERLAALDETRGKNEIIQGVEFNSKGYIVAYWIYPEHPSDSVRSSEPKRISAQDILHIYHPTRPNQIRGISRVSAVARNFEALNQFMDNELTKARVGSSFAYMIKRSGISLAPKFPSTGDTQATYDANNFPTDSNGNPLANIEGGMLFYGGPNDELKGAGPSIQTTAFAEFIATNLRAIATGLNMSYELLARDYSKTNYSSARQSSLEDRRHWEPRQGFLINRLCVPVWKWFVDLCVIKNIQPFKAAEKRLEIDWITPTREHIDPQKEIDAEIKAVQAGFTNAQKISAKYGTDVHENIRLTANLLEEAKESGIGLSIAVEGEAEEAEKEVEFKDEN